MSISLIRSFSRYEDACAAHDALIADGLPASCIEVRIAEDDGGPVEGNFVAGNGRRLYGAGPSRGVIAGDEIPYARNFRSTIDRGAHMLVIVLPEAALQPRVCALLERYGAVDPEAGLGPAL